MQRGAFKLFRVAGIQVYLHWWWFLAAAYEVYNRQGAYSSVLWNFAEYLALFLIVLTHEFGHAFATRQVGGTADTILLWPFGGVAYVQPPQRPGATLWAIAAGPLVNVALAPLLLILVATTSPLSWSLFAGAADAPSNLSAFIWEVLRIDVGLFLFNILPVYPLDGGQILRSLLWFGLGRGRSLMVSTVLGLIGVAGFAAFALWTRDLWLGLIALYIGSVCWNAFKSAKRLMQLDKIPRRPGFACPSCGVAPPLGNFWKCRNCQQNFDTFASGAVCPHCNTHYPTTTCLECRQSSPPDQWPTGSTAAHGVVSSTFAGN